jgi:methyltransferase family protein
MHFEIIVRFVIGSLFDFRAALTAPKLAPIGARTLGSGVSWRSCYMRRIIPSDKGWSVFAINSRSDLKPTTVTTTYRPPAIRLLGALGHLLPGDYLKTIFYLNLIEAPRRLLRKALFQFYRYDHVYVVLRDCKKRYQGRFSIVEFGTSAGYSFVKLLYATRFLGLEDRVTVYGFDSFEGMPRAADRRDEDLVEGDCWGEGQFCGSYEELQSHCAKHYKNFRLHKGWFESSVNESTLSPLRTELPILVWIDVDYYSSARTVLEKLIGYLPNGCVIYFDEYDNLNYGSRLTGEARLVHEINHGALGEEIELVLDQELSLNSRRIYRFVRFTDGPRYVPITRENESAGVSRRPGSGSPLP